jgi:hypothetical protein
MLAHAQIVVRTPYNHIPLAAWAIPECKGEPPCLAFQISEDAIALLLLQAAMAD